MITETKEIYKCEHCRKLYQLKRFAEAHEKKCFKNPENERACFGCVHLGKKETLQYYDTYRGEQTRKIDVFYCDKKEVYLFPPSVAHKGNQIEIENNEQMPTVCEFQNLDEDILNKYP